MQCQTCYKTQALAYTPFLHENPPPENETSNSENEEMQVPLPPPLLPPPLRSPAELLHDKCALVLELIESLGLTFGEFAVNICYGNHASCQPQITQCAWASLYQTNNLMILLQNSRLPPRCASDSGDHPVTGRKTINAFIFSSVQETFHRELAAFSDDQTLTDVQLAHMVYVATITSSTMYDNVKIKCPNLLATIARLTGDDIAEEQDEEEEKEEDE